MNDGEIMDVPTNKLASRVLEGSGSLAEIVKAEHGGGWDLLLDGFPNSSVDLWSPSNLNFTYANIMGGIIDYCFPREQGIKALHLGAGAMSIARFIEDTRPGSSQTVVEIDPDLIEFVLEHLPLPPGVSVETLIGDAREVVEQIAPNKVGSYDLIVLDIYSGKTKLTNLETLEFYKTLGSMLQPTGVLLMNIVDGTNRVKGSGPRGFSSSQLLTAKEALGDAVLCINEEDYNLGSWSNMVIAGSSSDRDLQSLTMSAENRSAYVLVNGDIAKTWMSNGVVLTDSDTEETSK